MTKRAELITPLLKDDPLHKEAMKELRCFVFASIISADNDNYTEEQKQEVIRRHKESNDWKYILEPVDDTGKFAKLFNYNDNGEPNEQNN